MTRRKARTREEWITDAEQLATKVIKLWQEGNETEARTLCQEKINEIVAMGYATVSIIKTYQPFYKRALRELSGINDYTQAPVCYFQALPEERVKIDAKYSSKIQTNEGRIELKASDLKTLYDDLRGVLESIPSTTKDWYRKGNALTFMTGRRAFSEICRYGEFTLSENPLKLTFYGQAKGGEEKFLSGYDIPYFGASKDLIIKTHSDFKEFLETKKWYSEELTDRQFEGKLKTYWDAALTSITNSHKFLGRITPHDCRKIYAAYAYWEYVQAGGKLDETIYIGRCLGHTYQKAGYELVRQDTAMVYKKYIII